MHMMTSFSPRHMWTDKGPRTTWKPEPAMYLQRTYPYLPTIAHKHLHVPTIIFIYQKHYKTRKTRVPTPRILHQPHDTLRVPIPYLPVPTNSPPIEDIHLHTFQYIFQLPTQSPLRPAFIEM